MAFSVQMPALGESVTEGTVTRWLKQEGDRVEVDEPLLEVSTDKVDTEIPSPAAGVLQRIVAGEDATVAVGGELAVIGDGSADAGDPGGDPPEEPTVEARSEERAAAEAPPAPPHEPVTAAAPTRPAAPTRSTDAPGTPSTGSGHAVTMPELGESVTEGTVTRWLKRVGDSVALDEPLLEVSTDKVDTEIPSPVAGTLLEITADEDATVEVGGRLALIGDAAAAASTSTPPEQTPPWQTPSGQAPSGQAPSGQAPSEGTPSEQARSSQTPSGRAPSEHSPATGREPVAERPPADGEADPVTVTQTERAEPATDQPVRPPADDPDRPLGNGTAPAGSPGAPYVTPLVRKLAAAHDVDLSTLTGSGVGGRIRKQDVVAAAEAMKPEPEPEPEPAPAAAPATPPAPSTPAPARQAPGRPQPGSTVKLPRLRQVIAQRMSESLRVSAQLTTVQEVDVTRVARLRARAKAEFERREGVKLTYLPFFAKATVEALKQFPQVNASIDDETKEVTYHGAVHLAIAVDTPRGLLVPVLKNAEDLNVAGLARRIADVAARTRESRIGPDELSGGTFTITNIGSAGALFDTPIINQPQVAILGTGVITKKPVVMSGPDGEDVIAIRSMCFLPLTYDHRLVDGADAGRFVSAVKARLEEGAFEADLGL